jgi:hypothetical protein
VFDAHGVADKAAMAAEAAAELRAELTATGQGARAAMTVQ